MNPRLPICHPASRFGRVAYALWLLLLLGWLGAPAARAQLTSQTTATVYTDRPDYLPGDIVVIEGDGWQAGEAVTLVIDHSTISHGNTVLSATADANGRIRNDQFVIQPIHFGEFFTLDATGQTSGLTASTTFTDGVAITWNGAAANATLCAGSAGTFASNLDPGTGGGGSYVWKRGTTTVATTASLSLSNTTAADAGTYTLEYTKNGSAYTSNAITLTVTPRPTAAITSASTSICAGGTATVGGTVTATGAWTLILSNGGTATGNGNGSFSVSVAPAATATYTITSLAAGCNAVTAGLTGTTSVTVNALPAVSIAGTPTFCAGGSTTLTASATPGSGTISSYQWYRNGVAISNGNSPIGRQPTYDASTAGSYTVAVTNSNTCAATSAAVAVSGTALPATPTISAGGATTFCQGGSVGLSSSAAAGYQWYRDGTAIPNATAQSYTAGSTGSYTVQVTNSGGCPATSAATAVVADAPPTTASAGPAQTVAGTTTTLAANAPSLGTGTWAIISGTNGAVAAPASPTSAFNGTAGTSYTLRWTIANGTCSSASDVAINFVQRPTTLSVSPVTATYGTTATLSATLTLTSGGAGIGGKTITFVLGGTAVGTATTNASGLATLTGVSLSGFNASATPYAVAASFAAEPSYAGSTGTSGLTVGKASQTISLVANPPTSLTFGTSFGLVATASSGLAVTYASDPPLSNTNGNYTTTSGTGTGTVRVSQGGNGNYESAPTLTFSVAAAKADATVNVTGYSGLYDGQAHGATGTATGVGGISLSSQLALGASYTNYPGGTASWSFAGGDNYNSTSGSATIAIGQAPLTIKANDQTKTYGQTLTFGGTEFAAAGQVAGEVASLATLSSAGAGNLAAAGTYAIVPSAVQDNGAFKATNYALTYQPGTLTVGLATPSLSLAVGGPYTYTGSGHPATATLTGVNNDVLTATLTYRTSAGALVIVPVEADTYSVTASFAGNANYSAVPDATGTLVINPAPATLALTTADLTQTYSGSGKTVGATATPGAAGVQVVYSQSGTGVAAPTAAGTYTVTATLSNPNYQLVNAQGQPIASVTGTLTIGKAPVVVTLDAASLSATYNGQAHAATAQAPGATGLSTFAITYDNAPTAPTDYQAGGYAVRAVLHNDNYAGETTGTLTIGQAPLTVTTDSKSKTYGSLFDAATYNGSLGGNVASDHLGLASYASAGAAAGAPVAGGPYAITATLNDPNNRLFNYSLATNYGSLTIDPAALTVTAQPATRLYGDPNPAFTATYSGAQNGESFGTTANSAATPASGVGSYDIIPVINGTTLANYQLTTVNSALTITQATLTVTADNKGRVYGAANPALTASYSGFKNGETLATSGVSGAPALSTPATATSPVGTYPIAAGAGTLASANYSFAPADGTLTIGKATASVVVAAASKVYGASDPAFTGTVSGLVAADGITVTYGRVAGETVGSYAISAVLSPAAALSNYNLTNTPASLTISKAALTVVADNKTKVYGQANPVLTGTLTGVVAGDNITATYSTTATQGTDVGSYTIVPALADPASKLSNYTVATTNGTLTITPQTANPVADTYYTGASFYWTTSATSSTATLNLVATLRNNFNYAGDIRTAKVSFYVRSGTTLTPINGAQNLPVGLVNPNDLSVGTAAANVQYNISGTAATLDIAVLISGNYRTIGLPIDKEITVAVPTPGGLIAGGGTFDAAGTSATGAGYVKGSASFAFYVQYNKSLKNPQGGAEITVTSYNDRTGNPTATLHTYKLRSNAISTLSTTNPDAQFSSKANIAEVTSTGEQAIEGNCIMQLTLYDGYRNPSVPSTTDKLAITVYRNGGGIWYSSAWDGTKTVVRDVAHRDEVAVTGAGGSASLVAPTATTSASRSAAATPAPVAAAAATTLLEVYPMPLTAQGTIHFQTEQDGPAQVLVYNAVGALVATLHSAPTTAGQDYYLALSAEKLANGIYFCRLVSAGRIETRRFVIQH